MAKQLTEKSVQQKLDVDNWAQMPEEKIPEFISLIPYMDKDVVLAIVNQFPAYSSLMKCMIEELGKSCDAAMKENSASQQQVYSAYRKILDDLGEIIKRENITEEERDRLIEKMIDVADKMSAKDTENKGFLSWLQKNKGYLIGGAFVIGGAILGVSLRRKNSTKA